jgi:hypothetical protein
MDLNFPTGIKRRKTEKIPYNTKYNTTVMEELHYKLSL